MSKIKVVTIGGGNGSAVALVALKQNIDLFDINGVVSMADSGGSSGRLRKEFKVLPPGDIMRAVLALSKYDYPMLKKVFYSNRFDDVGKLSGHDLGNIFLVLAEKYCGSYEKALAALHQAVEAVGRVYPVTNNSVNLCARLEDGSVVKTEAKLDEPKYDRNLLIKKVWLEPKAKATAEAKKLIKEADYILLCPGTVVGSVVATLLPVGISDAIRKTKAKLIYLAGGAYTIKSETVPMNLSGIVWLIEAHLPRKIDLVVYNNHKLGVRELSKYTNWGWAKYELDTKNLKDHKLKSAFFERDGGGLCAIKLGKILKKILK